MSLAEQISGRQLDAFFRTWLFATEKPPAEAVLGVASGSRVAVAVPTRAVRWAHGWLRSVEARTR